MKHIGRKFYHLLGGLSLLLLYFLLERRQALLTYAILFIAVAAFEVARLLIKPLNEYLFAHFASFFRNSEKERVTGTGFYVLGIGLTLFLFRTDIAAAAISFLAVGDVAATTVGERYGRTKIGQKSLEGTLAFAVAALVAGHALALFGIDLPGGLILSGALIAAVVELLPVPVNDNLSIPVIAGGSMEIIARYLQGG
jgi:acyl phosphate:glycerol-3-phosphate acyltransferase